MNRINGLFTVMMTVAIISSLIACDVPGRMAQDYSDIIGNLDIYGATVWGP